MDATIGNTSKTDIKAFLKLSLTQDRVPYHIEPSQLIYIANRLPGFYKMENIGR